MKSLRKSNRIKRVTRSTLLGAAFLFLQMFAAQAVFAVEDQWQDVERVVAVGDIHGDYDNFLQVLRDAKIVNRRGNWIGEDTHLVQLGDVPDRGPDTEKVIALLQKLERQAPRDGGMVHVLIGNHEAMNMYGDLRYVHPEEYAAFRTRSSRRIRDAYYQQVVERLELSNPEFIATKEHRDQWEQSVPLGMIEHRAAWSADGEIGEWVSGHNAVIKINRTLFLHAGISPLDSGLTIREINDQIRHELQGNLGEEPGLSERDTGPLWYRGLATNDEAIEQAHLEVLLAAHNIDRIVVGHTPGLGTIVPRFEGRVLIADTGLSSYYGGFRAALILQDGEATTLQGEHAVPLPSTESEVLPYFQRIAELEPDALALRAHINDLSTQAE